MYSLQARLAAAVSGEADGVVAAAGCLGVLSVCCRSQDSLELSVVTTGVMVAAAPLPAAAALAGPTTVAARAVEVGGLSTAGACLQSCPAAAKTLGSSLADWHTATL